MMAQNLQLFVGFLKNATCLQFGKRIPKNSNDLLRSLGRNQRRFRRRYPKNLEEFTEGYVRISTGISHRIFQNLPESPRIFQNPPESPRIPQNPPESPRIPQNPRESDRI